MSARPVFDPEIGLIDGPARATVSSLVPGQRVTLSAFLPAYLGRDWASEATFIADESGVVDVMRDAPVDGSYDGVDPMGLYWSAKSMPASVAIAQQSMLEPLIVTITAEQFGQSVASATATRQLADPAVRRLDLRDDGLVGALFLPGATGPYPAVLVLGGSEGGLGVEPQAALLASHGYAALALAYFGIAQLPAALLNIPLEYSMPRSRTSSAATM